VRLALLAQGLCLLAVIAGAAIAYWPAGLIIGGLIGAAVIERQT